MMLSMNEITQFTLLQALSGLPSLFALAVFTDVLRSLSRTFIRNKNSKIKKFRINNWDNFRKYFPTPRVRKIMYIAPTIIYFLGYLAIRISPCGKIDTFLGFAAMGISNGVLLTSSSKPIPNELGGKFAGQVYAYTNTICNIGSLVCKRLK